MFKRLMTRVFNWLQPSVYIGGLGDLFTLWQGSDARGRAILVISFTPMFICIGGFLLSIASFVLFVLPSYVLKFLGWLLLIALFSVGGRYCYEHMMRRYSAQGPSPDPTFSSSGNGASASFTAAGTTYDMSYTDVKFTEDAKDEEEERDAGADEAEDRRTREEIRKRIFRKAQVKE